MEKKIVYLVIDKDYKKPVVYKVETHTKEEYDFIESMSKNHCYDECEKFRFGHFMDWMFSNGTGEDYFEQEDLDNGVWPSVLTEDFKNRFTEHSSSYPVFLATTRE